MYKSVYERNTPQCAAKNCHREINFTTVETYFPPVDHAVQTVTQKRIDKMSTVVATHCYFFTRKILTQPTQANFHRAERFDRSVTVGLGSLDEYFSCENSYFVLFYEKSHFHKKKSHPT